MTKGISVIIPNYNYKQFIEGAVASIVAQDYRPLEIIVVDDCSSDGSQDVLREMEGRDFGEGVSFRSILLEENGKVAHARNTGAKAAKYDYICFMDVDDIFYNPKKLTNEMALVEKYAECGEDIIAYSRIVYMDADGNITGNQGTNPKRYMEGVIKYNLISGFKATRSPRDYVIKKDLFDAIGGYDNSSFYEDLDLLMRLSLKYRFFCTQEWGTAYRRFDSGLSSKPYEEHLRTINAIRNKYYELLPFGQKIICSGYRFLHALRNFARKIKGEKVR